MIINFLFYFSYMIFRGLGPNMSGAISGASAHLVLEGGIILMPSDLAAAIGASMATAAVSPTIN